MSKLFTARLLLGGGLLLSVAAAVVGATYAFFNDLETAPGNSFNAGELDLKIDNHSYYNGVLSNHTTWELDDLTGHLFFDFHDVKPGDFGEDTISIHVQTNDAWACFDTELTSDDDNGTNDLEIEAGDDEDTDSLLDGELGGLINFTFWADDGDNVFEADEVDNVISAGPANTVLISISETLADSTTNLFTGNQNDPLLAINTYYIAKAWCFGTLTQAPLTQDNLGADSPRNPGNSSGGFSCDGSGLDNISQSDSLTADVHFSAIQSRNNPNFVCDEEGFACEQEANSVYAVGVESSFLGTRANGTPITDPNRTDPSRALGVPESNGLINDAPVVIPSFFSLGFAHSNNSFTPGEVVLDMGQVFFPNNGGDDLFVYETTGGTYPLERVHVYASLNSVGPWTDLGIVNRDGGVELTIPAARYVRLVDESSIGLFEPTADAYDLDGVEALCTQGNQQVPLDDNLDG